MVFGFFRKKIQTLSELVDLHNHTVYGLDDGSPSREDSLRMLTMYCEAGYRKVSVSSHLFHPLFPDVTAEKILHGTQQLNQLAQENNLAIECFAGAEIYFHGDLIKNIEEGKALTVANHGKGGYFLIEFSPSDPMNHMKEVAFEVSIRGYKPLLAHPERYPAIMRSSSTASEWKEAGWSFQLNLVSLFAKDQKKKVALHLLKQGMYDLTSSDLHRPSYDSNLLLLMVQELQKTVGDEKAFHLLSTNPHRALNGDYLLPFEENED